jgi:hypothetical protein
MKKLNRSSRRSQRWGFVTPVELVKQTPDDIHQTIRRLVADAGDPSLTGVCCINLDKTVSDTQVSAVFQAVEELRQEVDIHE